MRKCDVNNTENHIQFKSMKDLKLCIYNGSDNLFGGLLFEDVHLFASTS